MFRGLIRYAVVLLLPLALVPAGAARADFETGPVLDWHSASCATGRLTGVSWVANELILRGEAARCDFASDLDASFGVVFHDRMPLVVALHDMRTYGGSRTSPRLFGVRVNAESGPVLACLNSSPSVRIACAEVRTDGVQAQLAPISVNDPKVDMDVYGTIRMHQSPNCGGCF